jgi:DNA-binding transcriptional regulator/RsmH inhibitor MraZ
MNFYGLYIRKVDESGRTTLPPAFRQGLKEELTLLAQPKDKYLVCCPSSLLRESRHVSVGTRATPSRIGEITVSPRSVDDGGRVYIPSYFRKHAEISHNVVIVGLRRYLELWSEKNWQAEAANARSR